jgi:Flp pilus assembly protein TadG
MLKKVREKSRASADCRRHSRRGQSLVEFTFIAPFLLIVTTGVVSFGLALRSFIVLTYGANMAAETVAMSRGITTDPCATASSALTTASPSLTSSNITLTVTLNGTAYSGNSCTSATSSMVQGATAQVTASYPCIMTVYGMANSCGLATRSAQMIQ